MPFVIGMNSAEAVSESDPNTPVITTDRPFGKIEKEPDLSISDDTSKENTSAAVEVEPSETKTEEHVSRTEEMTREYFKKYDGKTVAAIFFEGAGNKTLPTLQSAVVTHVGDEFNTDTAIRDLNVIKNLGYFYDAYQTITEVPEGVMMTYHVLENPILKDIEFTGNTVINTEDLERIMTVERGEVLNSNTLHDNIAEVQEKYHGDGYIMMKISDINVDKDGILHLKINEGVLEGYKVSGNKKTKDKVVLREMRQKVGEPFNAKLARRSIERVYNLGFFEDVNAKMLSGVEPNAVVMEVEVKERRTGTFGVGAGYSTRDGLLGSISIGDKNFRGRGDALNIVYEKSADERDAQGFSFSFRRPWLDKRETAAVLKIYNRTYEYADYDTDGGLKERYMRKYSGGEITVSRPHSEYSTNYLTLKQRKDRYSRHVSNGKFGDRSTPEWEKWRNDNFGTTRTIEYQHVTDTRDNIYSPSTGQRVSLNAEFGGLLGGDFKFQKFYIDHAQFYRAGAHSQVWMLRGAYGLGYGDLTEFNQFRIGGQGSIRGYRDDQFRGNRMMLATLEYRFPLAKKVQGIVFGDCGGAWNGGFVPKGGDIYGSVGLGLALNTPFGPLRLDYGRGSQGGRFHFNVGGSF
ncbi:MAG: BamA/TamA family outer membrane protein [Selenomonadaceae bacterium]|nr:BamA/TamA family outer membrane protein [Selenomonadaceae bacterium]